MRRILFAAVLALMCFGALGAAPSWADTNQSDRVLRTWNQLVLELVRHTPTYSPPVASRSFAYLGVTAFEAVASGSSDMQSLARQLNGLTPVPQRETGKIYDEAVVLQAAMAFAAQNFFENTGPTGQRALASLEAKLRTEAVAGLPDDVAVRSEDYGRTVAKHILAWSQDDGLPPGIRVDQGRRQLGADQLGSTAAKAPTAEMGQEPHVCDAKWRDV